VWSEEHTSSRRKKIFVFYVFLALMIFSSGLLLFSTRSFILNIQELGLSAFSGLRIGISAVGSTLSNTIDSIQELANLRKDYADLQSRLDQFEIIQRDAAQIKIENVHLREQLGFAETIQYRKVFARIIGKDSDNLFSAFVINKGSKQGIKRNMIVIAYQSGMQSLVGKIVQVGYSQSLMMPVYDSNSFVSARFSAARYEGLVSGQGNQDRFLLMRYVKKRAREEIKYGDRVVTSGLGGIYPPDLFIGRVARIVNHDYETSIDVELESSVDYSRLEYIFAIENESEAARDD
jgi:rod shape-determining protein MreC